MRKVSDSMLAARCLTGALCCRNDGEERTIWHEYVRWHAFTVTDASGNLRARVVVTRQKASTYY